MCCGSVITVPHIGSWRFPPDIRARSRFEHERVLSGIHDGVFREDVKFDFEITTCAEEGSNCLFYSHIGVSLLIKLLRGSLSRYKQRHLTVELTYTTYPSAAMNIHICEEQNC
jgi:hypothetical protein